MAILAVLACLAGAPDGRDSGFIPNPPVNLLRLIDPKRDTVEGTWVFEDGVLVCAEQKPWARIQIPYVPPDEYDLTLVAERTVGLEAINIGLNRKGVLFHAVVDGWNATLSGLSTIDRKWANKNETMRPGRLLANGRPATIVCRVRNDGVSMTVDGKTIFDWKGKYVRLGNIHPLAVPHEEAMYLNAYNCLYRFREMILKPVSGRGRRLHAPAPNPR